MTSNDILRIPEITKSADKIELGEKIRGLDRLIYRKQEVGEMFVIEEVRVGRKKLALVTAYKTPTDIAGVTPAAPAVPEEALAHTSGTTGVNVSNSDTRRRRQVPSRADSGAEGRGQIAGQRAEIR